MFTVQFEELVFDESDKLSGKFCYSSVLAFAESVAQAKAVYCWKSFAERVEFAEEVCRVNRHAPTADVSVALEQGLMEKQRTRRWRWWCHPS